MSNLVDAYIRYRVRIAEVKRRQKQERDAEMLPFLRDVGYEIAQERKRGTDIDGIKTIIGNKNQTFIYAAKRAFEASEDTHTPDEDPSNNAYAVKSLEQGIYTVQFEGSPETWVLAYDDNGALVTPDEWVTHSPDRRKLYKQIIKEIENGAGSQ